MTIERNEEIRAFLKGAGWGDVKLSPLAGDASNRRYLRLDQNGTHTVFMDAPPEKGEDCRPFVAMTEWLRSIGLSAPEVLAMDLDQGFLVLEDLGDALYARHLSTSSQDEPVIYAEAIRVLVHLADYRPPALIGTGKAQCPLRPYDQATLDREAALLTEWWMPIASGKSTPDDLADEFSALVQAASATVEPARDVVVLRDYHAENLLWMPDRGGIARVGLLDYQDALAGHPAYDLVSLLEDARRDTSNDLQTAMVALYLHIRPELDATEFRLAYAALGAQRNLKIIGIFARLAKRDGKAGYLDLIPRVWGHLQRDLAHPSLAPLSTWVRKHVRAPDADTLARAKANIGGQGTDT